MPTATLSPGVERALWRVAIAINRAKDMGILTLGIMTASTTVDNLISRIYAGIVSGTTSIYGPEFLEMARILDAGIQLMKNEGLFGTDDTIAAALETINTEADAQDLRYLIERVLSDTGNLDVTLSSDPGADLPISTALAA